MPCKVIQNWLQSAMDFLPFREALRADSPDLWPFVKLIDGSQDVGLDQACAELRQAAQSISAELTGYES